MKRHFVAFCEVIFVVLILPIDASAQQSLVDKYPLIPQPREVIFGQYELKYNALDIVENDFPQLIEQLSEFLKSNETPKTTNGLKVHLIKDSSIDFNHKEGYHLEISKDVRIKANDDKGTFYGLQTLKQLIVLGGSNTLPQLRIIDFPAFNIRGFLHDTGRNFQSVKQLKEQIEILALYKYNTFHWHLTDNPAWRLESTLYPQLQSIEATSRGKGGFYTQEDFKEIIQFCQKRFITVIPEFDIPGHTEAFRKASGYNSMNDLRVKPILLNLFKELCSLADAETMPLCP
ncbi:MAG: hexosaminidase [Arcticibacterium sp.]|jgi:hexosaminidase